nr:PREDICTED: uncharacterized protein LOC108951340 isoform X2 [Musa acuminata subsp. malaccensis]
MSVISILSPSSALDVRVASGHQHARRPSVMLRFRDRATPSFLSEQNAPILHCFECRCPGKRQFLTRRSQWNRDFADCRIVDCSVCSINYSRYKYPARSIACHHLFGPSSYPCIRFMCTEIQKKRHPGLAHESCERDGERKVGLGFYCLSIQTPPVSKLQSNQGRLSSSNPWRSSVQDSA